VLVSKPGEVEFTYLVTNTSSADLEHVKLVDDNATPDNAEDDIVVECPSTLDALHSMTCTAQIPVDFGLRTNTAVVTANPVLDSEAKVSATDDAVVRVPELTIAKAITANAGKGTTSAALEGDTLTYRLSYHLADGPVTDGRITDVLPEGLVYVTGSATDNDEFAFAGYDDETRTLSWTAAKVTEDGSVEYEVKADEGSASLDQPLTNVAEITSNETNPDTDSADISVGKVEEATGTPRITPPPTDGVAQTPPASGSGIWNVLLVICGLLILTMAMTPRRARVRAGRNRRA
jgi:uncharacterized repeat protein (TIGR01451 family)